MIDDILEKWSKHLNKRLNLRKENGRDRWDCDHTFRRTEEYTLANPEDADVVRQIVEGSGQYCDCELMLNSDSVVLAAKKLTA